jgi:hypothetical protein
MTLLIKHEVLQRLFDEDPLIKAIIEARRKDVNAFSTDIKTLLMRACGLEVFGIEVNNDPS